MILRGMLLVLVAACRPIDVGDDTDTPLDTDPDALTSGRLYDTPMSLVWAQTSQSEEDSCVDLRIATNGAEVRSWSLRVDTQSPVDDLTFVDGADVRLVTEGLFITAAGEPGLTGDEEIEATFCAPEPAELIDMTATVVYADEPETDLGDPPLPYDFLLTPLLDFGLQFEENGVDPDNGGRCLRVSIVNLTAAPVTDWALEVTMDGPIDRVASEGLWFYAGAAADLLVILPDHDSRTIQPFDAEIGRVCLAPFAEPMEIRGGDAPLP